MYCFKEWSFPPHSLRVECMCGEKSSTRGIGQLVLQRLWQRWRGRKGRVYKQRDGHNRDDHHRCWQGDDPAYGGCQKWEGGLHKVLILSHTEQLLCDAVCPSACSETSVQTFSSFYKFTVSSSSLTLISPSNFVFPPFSHSLESRVFRPAFRRYVVLEGLSLTGGMFS